jgi:hypothetical protein
MVASCLDYLTTVFLLQRKMKAKTEAALPRRWWQILKWLQSKQELMCNPEGSHGSSAKGISCNGMKVALVHVSPCSCIFIVSSPNYLFLCLLSSCVCFSCKYFHLVEKKTISLCRKILYISCENLGSNANAALLKERKMVGKLKRWEASCQGFQKASETVYFKVQR